MEIIEEELEALEAIYDEDYKLESKDPLRVRISVVLDEPPNDTATFVFTIPTDGTYPESQAPSIDVTLSRAVGFFNTALTEVLDEEASKNMGESMIYALVTCGKEWLEGYIGGRITIDTSKDAPPPAASSSSASSSSVTASSSASEASLRSKEMLHEGEVEEVDELGNIIVTRKHKDGTPVTKESFEKWQREFIEKKREAKRKAELHEKQHQRTEYEKKKAFWERPTGRQLFEKDSTLVDSDATFDQDFNPEAQIKEDDYVKTSDK